MKYLSNEIAKQLSKISSELEVEKKTKRHAVRCRIESIKDAKELAEYIKGELSL